MRVGGLHRRGTSRRLIRHRLALSVPEDDIEAALETLVEEFVDPDRHAAIAYARRRRIGPWRRDDRDQFVTATLRRWGVRDFPSTLRFGSSMVNHPMPASCLSAFDNSVDEDVSAGHSPLTRKAAAPPLGGWRPNKPRKFVLSLRPVRRQMQNTCYQFARRPAQNEQHPMLRRRHVECVFRMLGVNRQSRKRRFNCSGL